MAENDLHEQPLHEELSAYLDGELDSETVRQIEERLAREPAYRAELQRLERAWNLLDRLPRSTVSESFTKTTIEMVAVAASQEAEELTRSLPNRQRRARLLGVVALLAVAVVGFFIGHSLWPDPNRQLLADLPVIENFELYYQVDNIEFLRMLDRDSLFADSGSGPAADAAIVAPREVGAERRQQIAQMTLDEQQDLLRKQERFAALSVPEQDRLRDLQAATDADPKSAELHAILVRYHEWLKTLGPGQRSDLADLQPAERAAKVKQYQQIQQAARQQTYLSGLLKPRDHEVLSKWAEQFVKDHRDKLLDEMDVPSSVRKRIESNSLEPQRERQLLMLGAFHRRGPNAPRGLKFIDEQSIDALTKDLSPRAKHELTQAADVEARREIIASWISSAFRRGFSKQRPQGLSRDLDNELVQFFEHDLSEPYQKRLLSLPPEQMREELLRAFFDRRPDFMKPGGPRTFWDRPGARDPERPRGSDRGKPPSDPPKAKGNRPGNPAKPTAETT